MLTGENGILKRAGEAKEETERSQAEELSQLSQMNNELQNQADNGFEKSKNVNRPQLTTGMTRIMYNASGKVILDGQSGWDESNWYNYTEEEKKWANVQTKDGSMWVWIPRFAYYIDESKNMEIKFLVGTTNKWYDEETGEYKDLPSEYKVHACFQNGSSNNYANGEWKKEITGFWVAKFEAGLPDESSAPKTTSVSGMNNSYYPVFQGLKGSYNYINISQCYLLSQAITENGNPYGITSADSHLIKNSEWGAVAYLSYSKYGKTGGTYDTTKEVYANNVTYAASGTTSPVTSVRNNGVYGITGYAASGIGAATNVLSSIKLGDTVKGNGTSYAWYTENGGQASTTGNIYGVYDMSGCSAEYTSSYIKMESNDTLLGNLKNYGYAFVFKDDEKTEFVGNTPYVTEYPEYTNGGLKTKLEEIGRYGDGYVETWGWFNDWTNNDASGPFSTRGCTCYYTTACGVFAFDDAYGSYNNHERVSRGGRVAVAL